jgi:hypothetical protein
MANVQSRSFNGHSWALDLLSQIRSRSRAFRYHLSAIVVASGPSCWAGWYTVHPLLAAVVRPRVQFYQNCNSHYQIHSARASIPAD